MNLDTAKTTLLAPHDLETAKLERVFGTLAAHKVDYADLYFQYSRYEGWSLEEGIVKSGSFNIEQGTIERGNGQVSHGGFHRRRTSGQKR